jgi:site-specific DNA-methyltransferase (adenine-specific)
MERNTIICADVFDYLATLPDNSVDAVITSPPYWLQRDYQADGQIGLEETLQEYMDKLVAVFLEVKRVMKPTATLWINMGDKFLNKQLLGLPWRLAFALQDVGFILRSDIIWSRPNPMPESVLDRPTKSHEYIFLLTKRAKYFYDGDSIREKGSTNSHGGGTDHPNRYMYQSGRNDGGTLATAKPAGESGRNRRTVWTVATQPLRGMNHFAAFPEKLIEPCILAGCPREVCSECGAPVVRVVDKTFIPQPDVSLARGMKGAPGQKPMAQENSWDGFPRGTTQSITIGWTPTCDCNASTQPGLILDPFMGAGTTAIVARRFDRDYIGCDISQEYVDMALRRLSQSDPYEVTETEAGEVQLSLFSD